MQKNTRTQSDIEISTYELGDNYLHLIGMHAHKPRRTNSLLSSGIE